MDITKFITEKQADQTSLQTAGAINKELKVVVTEQMVVQQKGNEQLQHMRGAGAIEHIAAIFFLHMSDRVVNVFPLFFSGFCCAASRFFLLFDADIVNEYIHRDFRIFVQLAGRRRGIYAESFRFVLAVMLDRFSDAFCRQTRLLRG